MAPQDPPSPPGYPIFGHSFAFTNDPLEAMQRWSREHGDVVELSFPGWTIVMVTRPDYIRRVIEADADVFRIGRAQQDAFQAIEEGALVVSQGEDWKRLRRIMQPSFTPSAVEAFPGTVRDRTDELLATWEPGRVVNVYDAMSTLTIRIVSACLLGVDIRGREQAVRDAADAVIEGSDATSLGRMVPGWIPTPRNRRFRRAKKALYGLIEEVIAEKRDDPDHGEDLLGQLIEAHDGGRLSRQELHANVCSLFLAGSDTSSAALTYTLFCLGRHPDAAVRLGDALDDAFAGDGFDAAAAAGLPPVRHAIEEAMRLYPPAFSVGREATEEYVLDGYRIPEGAQVLLPQWVVHRDPRFFEDPEAYRPSRWERDEERPKYVHFPFGGGRRFCIGSHFAMMEMAVVVTRILRRVEFEVLTETIEEFVPAATLRPAHPVEMRVEDVDV